jgi:leucyl aminopeptidase
MTKVISAGSSFDPPPSLGRADGKLIRFIASIPPDAEALGILIAADGQVPGELGLERAALAALGFDAKISQTLVLPRCEGPTLVAIDIGSPAELDACKLRDVAAAFVRAVDKYARLATTLADIPNVPPESAGRAVVEGMILARYRYDSLKREPSDTALAELTLVVAPERLDEVTLGADRGRILAGSAELARDLANAPPAHLTATRMAEMAARIAADRGLGIEIFDENALAELGCGGMLAVNAGSTEPPRIVKLTYRPGSGELAGHLTMVGKGVMYDSGGISLKPSDAMHAAMKMDMSGAGAVLAAMSALPALKCRAAVTAYLMCTDNMPSGSAMKMGDVLTIRGGKTVEIHNTDAEGRLALADGLVLAVEQRPDAIVDIGTLTGACLRALGDRIAGVFGNNQHLVDQVTAAARSSDEPVWQLPLDQRYRKQLDSNVADMRNVGGDWPGAITAALFLAEFVDDVPWAYLDITGTMKVDADESWRSHGATGFGARLLIELAMNFARPPS